MAKGGRAKTVQKKLHKLKKAEQQEGGDTEPVQEGPAPPVRIQQKLTKKVKFLQRVAASKTAALSVKAGVGKKKKKKGATLADLSTLMSGLDEAKCSMEEQAAEDEQRRKPGQSVGSLRGRARVLEQETARLQQVLHHPQFLANPLAAVKNHLAATLPAAPAAPVKKAPGAKLSRSEKKKRQKANRAAAAAMQDDD